jgi:hypothetical protein
LLTEINRVRESVQQLSNLSQAQGKAEEFALRGEQVDGPTRRIQNAVEFLVAASSEHFEVPPIPAAVALLKDVTKMRESYLKDPNLILAPGFVSFSSRLLETANAVETIARDLWATVRSERLTLINQSLLVSLESLPGYASTISELRRLNSRAAAYNMRPLVSASDLSEFLQIAAELQAHWQVLCSPERMPAEVITFLQACAEGGAGLSLLTTGVGEWLANNSLESQFRIRMNPS